VAQRGGLPYRLEGAENVIGLYTTIAENLTPTPPSNVFHVPRHPKNGAHFFRVVRVVKTPQ